MSAQKNKDYLDYNSEVKEKGQWLVSKYPHSEEYNPKGNPMKGLLWVGGGIAAIFLLTQFIRFIIYILK